MRQAFLEYLCSKGVLSGRRFDEVRAILRGAPEPIGAIAYSYGLLKGPDVDAILEEQRRTYRLFGEIAWEMGILSREQVETLLHIQKLRAASEVAEALSLAGICQIEEVIEHLGCFLAQGREASLSK